MARRALNAKISIPGYATLDMIRRLKKLKKGLSSGTNHFQCMSRLAVNFVKGIAASALVAVLFEKTEKTRQQLFVCWKFTACFL